ncbi:hypothetical protein [Clostridium taeniosporum]|uniref:Lipoprotein n=1 Tax=Clostridium taeniosporum TaxID=394958 RepID=A0A1D7XGS6_9CLOT|nr:hypothetical protein [Clostridium taeniosporum]AOR22557.1 hypothetical protein BGI42_02010 [Clostridium taeniosporum]
MKKFINMILVILMSFFIIGCNDITQNKIYKIKPPENNSLSIKGIWRINDYKILDNDIYSLNNRKFLIGEDIEICNEYVKLKDIDYGNITYKLKLVKDDYVISYEEKYNIGNLNLNKDNYEVISVFYNNNIMFEFIKNTDKESFIFYNGALYNVSLVSQINQPVDSNIKKENNKIDSNLINYYNYPVGVYLGIKSNNEEDNTEEYKTVYVSFQNDKLQPIREKSGLIVPRMNGIWSINKKYREKNDYYYEYFNANPINNKDFINNDNKNLDNIDKNRYISINFVGNDYIATEVYEGNKFTGKYGKYEVLPIDNITSNIPIVISDIYSDDAKKVFKQVYDNIVNNFSEEEKQKYSSYINYSNFSLKRANGKWNVIGKISPAYGLEDSGYDYTLNFKHNKKLVNYDSLLIPWKTLKRELPDIKDAFTSPNERIALILTEKGLLIYEIENSKINNAPLDIINMDHNDQIIMAEWCIGDYVDNWAKPFLN